MILYSKSGWASVLWRRLELACELESNPQDCFTGLVRPILDLCLVRLEYPIYWPEFWKKINNWNDQKWHLFRGYKQTKCPFFVEWAEKFTPMGWMAWIWSCCGRKKLVDFNAGSACFIWQIYLLWCFWCENEWVSLAKKSTFKILGLPFSSKLDCSFYIVPTAKTERKLESWFVVWSSFFYMIWPFIGYCCHFSWGTVAICG